MLGTLVVLDRPYWRASREGDALAGISCLGGDGRSCSGSGGGWRDVGVLAPKPRSRASRVGTFTGGAKRAGEGVALLSRLVCGGSGAEEKPN